MKKKIRPLFRCIIFLLILSLLLVAATWVVIPKRNAKADGMHNARAYGYLAEKENTIDIAVIGDSETYSAFSPMELWQSYGYTGFICGTPAQHLEDTYSSLEQFCEYQTPKLVILEANAMFRSSGLYSDAERIFFREIEKALPLFEYHDRWKRLSPQDFTGRVEYDCIDPLKGFYPTYYSKEWKGGHGYMKKTEKVRPIQNVNLYYFDKIAEFCRERGIQLLVVNAPAPVNWNYQKHNAIKRLTDEYGLPYLDMNFSSEEMGIDWSHDSRDGGDHMNVYGALKVTSFFGKYLNEKYDLPDHRGDKKYANWDQDLKDYQDILKKGMKKQSSKK